MSINRPSFLKFENMDDVHSWLNTIPAFHKVGMKAANMSLGQITDFCVAMGKQHQKIKMVHVAGTNGKGATCAILASAYHAAGYKTGMFTSPHLSCINERFLINGLSMPDKELLAFFQENRNLLERYPLTYFEITVAVGFWWFHKEGVDIAVIETGLGGRFDATNIIEPLVAVITTISLDHTNYLGDSLASITREKAGIIKSGIPVITGNITDSASSIIKEEARKLGSEMVTTEELSPAFTAKNQTFSLHILDKKQVFTSDLMAPVHCHNIAVAWQVIDRLNEVLPVSVSQFQRGLNQAGRLLPGRFEKLMNDRPWYFDGAHNKQALQALRETINTIKPEREAIVIFTLMKDKIDENMRSEFSGFKKIYYYTMKSQRAATYDDIHLMGLTAKPLPCEKGSLFNLLNTLKSELVIFTGSFYFYTTVKDWLAHFQVPEN